MLFQNHSLIYVVPEKRNTKYVLLRRVMTFGILLGLVMLHSLVCSSSQAAIIDTNYNQSFAPHTNVRGVDEEGTFSAGNTKCWPTNKCGKHDGKPYSWCYTDEYKQVEEKCCTGECTVYTTVVDRKTWKFFKCLSGEEGVDCGSPGLRNVKGTNCLTSHPCGTHGYKFYWCYTDVWNYWEYCCHPLSICSVNGNPNNHWCYIDYHFGTYWRNCIP
ncbi:hypothetical protein CHS0354_024977 [Potamilus streckersoni]|uniref:Uncharacterized protein n=1 Tax=Potamilus streckersoni TaxID=2493646 RepID=A0AAE0W738_9BIVA|nr:hypothetical protein CHS0354_024977 [Potamilus streckersoni]